MILHCKYNKKSSEFMCEGEPLKAICEYASEKKELEMIF